MALLPVLTRKQKQGTTGAARRTFSQSLGARGRLGPAGQPLSQKGQECG